VVGQRQQVGAVGDGQAGDAAQRVEDGLGLAGGRGAGEDFLDAVEGGGFGRRDTVALRMTGGVALRMTGGTGFGAVGGGGTGCGESGGQGGCYLAGAVVVQGLGLVEQELLPDLGLLEGLLARGAGVLQGVLGLGQGVEAQDAVQGVVQLGRALVQQRAQLVVGEEGPVGLQRLGPAEGVERDDGLAAELGLGAGLVEDGLRGPVAGRAAGAAGGAFCLLQDQLGLEVGLGVVEVAPAFLPDLRAVLPALAVAGQQQLQAFGEAGLAGAVAADDQGQAGARGQRQGLAGADAAEALDRDRAQVGGRGRAGGCGGFGGGGRSRGGPLFIEEVGQGLGALEGGQDEGRPGVVGLGLRVESLRQQLVELGGWDGSTSCRECRSL
jgi:hypothetical protein